MFTFYVANIRKDRATSNFVYKNAYEIAESLVSNFKIIYKEVKNPNRVNGVGVAIKTLVHPFERSDKYNKIFVRFGVVSDEDNTDVDSTVLTVFHTVDDIPKIGTLIEYFADLIEIYSEKL